MTQDEVKEKPQQVRDEDCNQNPENRLHRAPLGIPVDVAEPKQPRCNQAAEENAGSSTTQYGENGGTVVEVLVMLNGGPQKSHRQPDKRPADYKDERAIANGFGNHTQEWLDIHRVLSFRLAGDNTGSIGKSRKRQIEGMIQRANNPWRT
jgi:hypothetical protein